MKGFFVLLKPSTTTPRNGRRSRNSMEERHHDRQQSPGARCLGRQDQFRARGCVRGRKEGSLLNTMLADAAVVISIALQHGIPAAALAKSVGRLPAGPVAPASLDHAPGQKVPSSPIGAALDLLRRFEEN